MTAKVIVEARNSKGEVLHRIELDADSFDDGEVVKLYDGEIAALWFYREDKPPGPAAQEGSGPETKQDAAE